MIEENTPEINVDELMQKIREEVSKRQNYSQLKREKSQPIKINSMATFNPILAYIEGLLKNAEVRAEVRTKWPDNLNKFPFNFLNKELKKIPLKVLNFLFKDQREVNFNVIQALKESVTLNRQLIAQITSLKTQMDEHLNAVELRLKQIDERLDTLYSRVPDIDVKFNKIDTCINSWMTGVQERLDAVNSQEQLIHERLSTVDTHLQRVDTHLRVMDERHLRNDSYLKNDLVQQKRLITIFLEEARQRLPERFAPEQLQTFVNQEHHSLDALYASFEDHFRGSRKEIKNRLTTYIPFVEKVLASTQKAGIVDIGCGRGEWLDLLSNYGFKSSGIDINSTMVERCQELGLDVIESDGLSYLRAQEDNSLAIVSAFHVIEHLPFREFICLIEEALRVLCPGGIVIFETPNPENLIVGACNFYLDPTHRNPIPPNTAQFLLENRGFRQVEIHRLQPMGGDHGLENAFLNSLLLGSQDYAVIGWKQ